MSTREETVRAPRTAAPRTGRADEWLPQLPGYLALRTLAEMGRLLHATCRRMITRPFSWTDDFLAECSIAIRRCVIPLTLSMTFFALGLGIVYFGGIVGALGTLDRIGGGTNVGWTREISMWVSGMILAGVAGSAMTADLGARKVREELDALAVLGVDNVRALVVPRVLAMVVAAPIIGVYSLLLASFVLYSVSVTYFGDSLTGAAFLETYLAFVQPADLCNLLVKLVLIGAMIGLVSCQKGLGASGGSEGVGRAVNQAVLITFFGVWTLNTLVNLGFLALFPDVAILRG